MWIPRNSVRMTPLPRSDSIRLMARFPGVRRSPAVPTAGGTLGAARRRLAVVPVPNFLPQNVSARKPASVPSRTRTFRRDGTPSPSKSVAPVPSGSSGSSTTSTSGDATGVPILPANIDLPFFTFGARKEAASTSRRSAAASFSRIAATRPVGRGRAPSIRRALRPLSSAIGPGERSENRRQNPNPYPVDPSDPSSATESTEAKYRDSR